MCCQCVAVKTNVSPLSPPRFPRGSDYLQVAIDVSGDGRLGLPPYPPNIETGLFNLTLFLTSYTTGLNLTISNGTRAGWVESSVEPPEFGCDDGTSSTNSNSGFQNAGCQRVLLQEPGSTVKHVNWVWPNCLVGNGGVHDGDCGTGEGSVQDCLDGTARGSYNVRLSLRTARSFCSFFLSFSETRDAEPDVLASFVFWGHGEFFFLPDLDPPVLPLERDPILHRL